jgi:anti-anti-sigma factor
MEITATEQDNVTIVTLSGDLDATTAEAVAERVFLELGRDSSEGGLATNVVIDLSGVAFMSSAGLRAILATTQEARNLGGDLRLASGNKNVKRVLDFSGFTKILKYYDTVPEAVSSFAD